MTEDEATMQTPDDTTRRRFLVLAGGAAVLGAVPVVTPRPAEATPAMLAAAIRNVVGAAVVLTAVFGWWALGAREGL